MASAVVDTSVLIARFDADDERHAIGFDIVRGIDAGDLPTGRVTNYVVLETLNWIHGRNRHDKATEVHYGECPCFLDARSRMFRRLPD